MTTAADIPDNLLRPARHARDEAHRRRLSSGLLSWFDRNGWHPSLLELSQERERRRVADLNRAMLRAVGVGK